MEIVVLMAGDGKRFTEVYGENCYKPLVEVKGKTILDWTLSSIPNIQQQLITFVVQIKHYIKNQKELNKTFFPYIYHELICLSYLTQGNLETAYFFNNINSSSVSSQDLLFLDSDNYYNGEKLLPFIEKVKETEKQDFAVICGFEPIDDSVKWCFMNMNSNNRVKWVAEKDPQALNRGGKPMVGVFYFSNRDMFNNIARKCFNNQVKTGNEFYLSGAIKQMINDGLPVYGLMVDNVIPLGTPEDVLKYENCNRS